MAMVLCVASACASDDGTGAADAAAALPLPADVDAVLEARCRKCHSDPPQNFAPFPLVTWQDTQAFAPAYDDVRIFELIALRIHDESFPMPPAGNPMSDADRAVLDAWIAAGAEPGD